MITFFFDRITKFLALLYLRGSDIVLFPGCALSFAWNRGVSWGLFHKFSAAGFWILTGLVALIIALFTIYTFGEYKKRQSIVFEALVLSGALSNLFDRIYYGAVIDFIDLYIKGWHWPTFNVADACIVIGIGGIIGKGFLCGRQQN